MTALGIMTRNSKSGGQKIHDRMSEDLPINAKIAEAIIPDPYSSTGEKLRVIRSVRDDPLAEMFARGYIDSAQYEAGRLWQRHYERSQIGSVRAIDPGKEAVDGGRFPDPLPDGRFEASDRISEADAEVGQDGCAILRDVLGAGMDITKCAARRGMTRQIDRRNISLKFKDCLEKLARLWNFA